MSSPGSRAGTLALRFLMTFFHQLQRMRWSVVRPRTWGCHAVALTPAGKVILVKLRYAKGWRLPGGGRHKDEGGQEAVLRELREEIGLTGYSSVEAAAQLEQEVDFKRDLASIYIVRDVEYSPRWSVEIEQVCEAELDSLPRGMSKRAEQWIEAVRQRLG